ncbi:MAG TPA: type VII secretion protein EccCa [Aldersonia sp.]
MTTVRFAQKPRREVPRTPGGEVSLQTPPAIPRVVPTNPVVKLLPVVMVVAMVGMLALLITSGGFGSNPMSLLFPAMMVVSMLGLFLGQGRSTGPRAAEIDEDRTDYLRYLDNLRDEVHVTADAQRTALQWSHPDPLGLWTLAGSSRMWERHVGDPDHCHVRVGRGAQRLATRLITPETGPVDELEPVAALSLRRFVRTHSVVADLPTAVSLRGFAAVAFEGDHAAARALVRSMLLQLCTFHGPDLVLVAVLCDPGTASEWEWVKWLPHTQHPDRRDGVGSERMCYRSVAELDAALRPLLGARAGFTRSTPAQTGVAQVVIVVDGGLREGGGGAHVLGEGGIDSVTLLDLCGFAPRLAAGRGLQLVVDADDLGARSGVGIERFARPDAVSVSEATRTARRLAPYRMPDSGPDDRGEVGAASWAALAGVGDVGTFSPARTWRPRYGRDRLRVPFGVGADGTPVELDLKEAAEGGMGPHGLCIGATGSGKSELLRTIVLGLVATHSPDQLNLVLVDFKGGATFLGLEGINHVSAVITNLEQETALVDRMRDALAGEMHRRQEVLRAAGNFANVGDYEKARAAGADLDPLPALFIVIDEFSELLSQQPEFAELFVAIGRLGRSLHIHLLLASQRLDEGKLRGLDSHLSYRIGLKTFSANESRTVLGVPDAYHLPAAPGAGYLKSDAAQLERFQGAYVSGPHLGARAGSGVATAAPAVVRPRLFTAASVPAEQGVPVEVAVPVSSESESEGARSTLAVLVARMRGHGAPAHEIWLPTLATSPTLDSLLPESVSVLRAPVAVVDRPFDQRRDRLFIDLAGAAGNVAIVGGPQSGKSTALRTLIMSMAASHSPSQVQFYLLDFGGGTLAGLAGLPHVGSVANRLDGDRVRRTVAEMTGIVRAREQRFRELGIESMAQFRRRVDPVDRHGDVFLVIDGFASIRQDFEALEQQIANLATQGLSYGVHVILSAGRWGELRPALKDQLGTRIELRLGDPADSDLGRRLAVAVPEGMPGRGMTREGLHLLVALPRLDGVTDPRDLADGVAGAVQTIAAAAARPPAPPVRMLPDRLDRTDLLRSAAWPAGDGPCSRIPIGIDESELTPAYLDFAEQPHLLVFGDSECGKTTLLRGICAGVMAANTPQQAKIIVGDYRRTMLGVVDTRHLASYAPTADRLAENMTDLAELLRTRLPHPDVTQQQLRDRSWWTGPEIYVVVDDYDLVSGASGTPLAPLLEFVAQSKDIGLHLIVARRVGGAARSLYEPVIARMRDVSCAGLVMSGSRDEGNLLGTTRAQPMPPGRGTLVTRAGATMIQTAWLPPL